MSDSMFRWEITFGQALTLAVAVVGLVVSFLIPTAWRSYRQRHPLAIDYPDQDALVHIADAGRTFSKVKVVSQGQSEVQVRLLPKREMHFQAIDFRCVNRRWDSWGLRRVDAPSDVVSVVTVRDLRLEAGDPAVGELGVARPDLAGGVEVSYSIEHRWPQGKPLWYIVRVQANEPWEGELSVCVERGEPRRYYGRAPLTVRLRN